MLIQPQRKDQTDTVTGMEKSGWNRSTDTIPWFGIVYRDEIFDHTVLSCCSLWLVSQTQNDTIIHKVQFSHYDKRSISVQSITHLPVPSETTLIHFLLITHIIVSQIIRIRSRKHCIIWYWYCIARILTPVSDRLQAFLNALSNPSLNSL